MLYVIILKYSTFNSLCLIFQDADLWSTVVENKYCENFLKPLIANVSNQSDCQQLCISKSECVGISYSYESEVSKYCYICLNDTLAQASNGFGFYRLKGEMYRCVKLKFDEIRNFFFLIENLFFGDVAISDPCSAKPCHNNGTCSKNGTEEFTCNCTSTGFAGHLCNIGRFLGYSNRLI